MVKPAKAYQARENDLWKNKWSESITWTQKDAEETNRRETKSETQVCSSEAMTYNTN